MAWAQRAGFGASAELPRGWLGGRGVRADARGLATGDGATLPWERIERLAMTRNRLGLPRLLVALRDGGRASVRVPLGVPIASVDHLVEIVDSHYRPAR